MTCPHGNAEKGTKMGDEFKPINTQEELNKVIGERLVSKEKAVREEYADYADLKKKAEGWDTEKATLEKTIADNKTAYDDLNQKLTEANGKIAKYETDALKTKVAIESGIPAGLISYLKGTTEEEIKKSAEELGKFTKGGGTLPPADPEGDPPKGDYAATGKVDEDRAVKKFIKSLEKITE